jgi:vacuolar-type H+-ATPase subunit D/Vma8
MELFDTGARIAVLENEVKNVVEELREIRKEQKEQHQAMLKELTGIEDRINAIEKWRYMVIGGAVVVGYLLAHLPILK